MPTKRSILNTKGSGNVRKKYKIIKEIGRGGFGRCY